MQRDRAELLIPSRKISPSTALDVETEIPFSYTACFRVACLQSTSLRTGIINLDSAWRHLAVLPQFCFLPPAYGSALSHKELETLSVYLYYVFISWDCLYMSRNITLPFSRVNCKLPYNEFAKVYSHFIWRLTMKLLALLGLERWLWQSLRSSCFFWFLWSKNWFSVNKYVFTVYV